MQPDAGQVGSCLPAALGVVRDDRTQGKARRCSDERCVEDTSGEAVTDEKDPALVAHAPSKARGAIVTCAANC